MNEWFYSVSLSLSQLTFIMGKKGRKKHKNNDKTRHEGENEEPDEGKCCHWQDEVKYSNLNNTIPHADLLCCQDCQKLPNESKQLSVVKPSEAKNRKSVSDNNTDVPANCSIPNVDTEQTHEPALCVCLRCGHIACSRQSPHKHALEHYKANSSHPVIVNLSNWVVWCYKCDEEIDHDLNSAIQSCLTLLNKVLIVKPDKHNHKCTVVTMAASLQSKVEEHLTCSVCLEQLKDPKVLPCLHSYCHECIVRLARNAKSINCPECRMTVKVDDPQNISTLPSNFFVNNLLATMALTDEKAAKTIVCDCCDSGDLAETRCKECGIFLCQYCTAFHRRCRATKVHELVSMDELKSNATPETIAEKIRCPKHKEEMIKLFCKTCQVTICRDCTIVDHRQHEYGFVEDVAVQEKQKLQTNLDEVKRRKVRVVQGISSLKRFDEGLIAKQKSTLLEINKHFDELAKVMTARRSALISKATSLTSLKQKQIHAQLEQLEMALATCDSSIEFTQQAFKNGNDVQILSMEKCILQSLENLKKVKDETRPCVSEQIVFCIPSSVKNTEQTLFNAYAVDDVVVSPEDCTASFNEPESHLELGKQFSITVLSEKVSF